MHFTRGVPKHIKKIHSPAHWWILCRFQVDKTRIPRINTTLSFVTRDSTLQLRIYSYASWKQGEKDDVSSENK